MKTILISLSIIIFYILAIELFNKNTVYSLNQQSIQSPPVIENNKFYTFGVVPQFEQRKLFNIWRPILNELEARTNIKIKMVGTAKIPDFTRKFLQGKFDFAYMNPYHVLQTVETQGYIPLVRDGGRNLKGIMVVHKDSGIHSIKQLQEIEFAFPSANALGASLLIKAELTKQNIRFQPNYVQTHSSVYLHVAKKLYPIGGGVLSTLMAQKEHVRNSLRVIYQSAPVPSHPISVHPRVPKHIQNKVKTALLEMSKSEHFIKYLNKIPIKKMVPTKIEEYLKLKELQLDKLYITEKI